MRANFTIWTLEDESRYFRTVGSRLTGKPFLSDSLIGNTFFSDSTYTLKYTLFYPHTEVGVPKLVRGNMQIHLVVDRLGRWSIDQWTDFKSPGSADSTWSFLKFWFNK